MRARFLRTQQYSIVGIITTKLRYACNMEGTRLKAKAAVPTVQDDEEDNLKQEDTVASLLSPLWGGAYAGLPSLASGSYGSGTSGMQQNLFLGANM